jgi:hypothetical protein
VQVRYCASDTKMVTTRGQLAADPNSTPLIGSGLVNPIRKVNWPPTPRTKGEFMQWMEATRQALLKWLRESRSLAQDEKSKEQILELLKQEKGDWKKYRTQTDEQTGSIYDKGAQIEMEKAMGSVKQRRAGLHQSLGTWHRYAEYRTAQSAWEDFLYYQNVWNRKNDKWKDVYHETAAERRAFQQEAGMDEKTSAVNKFEKRNPFSGTKDSDKIRRTDIEPNGMYCYGYEPWIMEIIKIFKTFRLGYRKQAPDTLITQHAHRYTQPPRGTTPTSIRSYRRRSRYLEERFPRNKRTVIDTSEIEEERRDRLQLEKDNELARKGSMVPISWSVDEDSFEKVRKIKESAIRETATKQKLPGYASDIRTQKLLPKGHQLHHASLETSFDWPTSFETASWDNVLLKTNRKSTLVYEEDTDTDTDDKEDSNQNYNTKKRKRKQYKLDGGGHKVVKMSRGRYTMVTVKKRGRIFAFDEKNDGTVVGRDGEGNWQGHWTDGDIEEREFKLDADGQRIPKAPRPIYRRVFSTTTITPEDQGMTRQSRHTTHTNKNVAHQLSDDEEPGRAGTNPNYDLSGNANPAQVGKPTVWDDDSGAENGYAGGTGDEGSEGETGLEEEESDDERDLFRLSYQECSDNGECPKRRRARELHARLVTELGILRFWNESHTLGLVDLNHTDGAIREEYMRMINARDAPRREEQSDLRTRLVIEFGTLPFWNGSHTLGLVELNHTDGAIREEYMRMINARDASVQQEQ